MIECAWCSNWLDTDDGEGWFEDDKPFRYKCIDCLHEAMQDVNSDGKLIQLDEDGNEVSGAALPNGDEIITTTRAQELAMSIDRQIRYEVGAHWTVIAKQIQASLEAEYKRGLSDAKEARDFEEEQYRKSCEG